MSALMNKFIKDQIAQLKPSATLAMNEESNRLIRSGKKVYKFGFGQSPFPIPESVISALKNNANKRFFAIFKNFYIIKKYNNTDYYALTIGGLANKIKLNN